MMSGDVGSVPPRIDVHYIPITPAQRKKHLPRCPNGVRKLKNASLRQSATRKVSARLNFRNARARLRENFSELRKTPMT
jgi:hypothetical protein